MKTDGGVARLAEKVPVLTMRLTLPQRRSQPSLPKVRDHNRLVRLGNFESGMIFEVLLAQPLSPIWTLQALVRGFLTALTSSEKKSKNNKKSRISLRVSFL